MKQNKFWILATSLLVLLPTLYGIAMWDTLPEVLPTHWGIDGSPDRWSTKSSPVFFLPLFFLGLHLLCAWLTGRKAFQAVGNGFIQRSVLFVCPFVSLFSSFSSFGVLADPAGEVGVMLIPMMGVTFLILGNNLPKCRQNYFAGIRIPWVYTSEENWNRTHRLGGKVWVICGILLLLDAFLGSILLMTVILAAAFCIPTVYSWLFYRRQKREGAI